MARFNNITPIVGAKAAAAAGTGTVYVPTGTRPFLVRDFSWLYETTEANADNTLDFAIDYATDGSTWVSIFANVNPNGLLDSGAPLLPQVNEGNAAASGGAAVAATAPTTRIPANAVVRFTLVTAGTGTIPAIQMTLSGAYV